MTEEEQRLDLSKSMTVIKVMFLLFTVAMVVLIAGLYVDARDRNQSQDDNRLTDAVSSCERSNITRSQINDINIAVGALAEAVDINSDALAGSAEALIAAVTPPGGLDPDDQANADEYRAGISALTQQVHAQLTTATSLLANAVLPLRDCDPAVVLEDPNATLPAEQG